MKKERKPIDDEHVAAVGDQLNRALASGPAPPKARTRQALIDTYAAKLDQMRQANFTLEEISRALSYKDVVFSPAMVSTYCSRSSALSTCSSTTIKKTKSKSSKGASKLKMGLRRQSALETKAGTPSNAAHIDPVVKTESSPAHHTLRLAADHRTIEEKIKDNSDSSQVDKALKTRSRTGVNWMNDFK